MRGLAPGTDEEETRPLTGRFVSLEDELEGAEAPVSARELVPCGVESAHREATKLAMWLGLAGMTLMLLAIGARQQGTRAGISAQLGLEGLEAEVTATNSSIGAMGAPQVVGSQVRNWGMDCWTPCGDVSGMCPDYCGAGNACCRFGSSKDPPECYGVTMWGSTNYHTCVKPVMPVTVWHQGQNCWDHCAQGGGYCNWCGQGNACCRFSAPDPVDCKGVTFWPSVYWHTCVSPNLAPPGPPLSPFAPTVAPCAPDEVQDTTGSCIAATGPAQMTFYMYRARNDENYQMENVNLASLTGAMWYLHNEVVTSCPRKFGLTRLTRYVVTVKNTQALWKPPLHYQFGQFVQFDQGQCTWNQSSCQDLWSTYGYVVGCQPVDTASEQLPNYEGPPAPVWYSLPGKCPSMKFADKTSECLSAAPGGECSAPDGSSDCTWSAEPAGEIRLDELSGITDFEAFCEDGNVEYEKRSDEGIGTTFWNNRRDATECRERVARVQQLFQLRYPNYPATLGAAKCDWYR